MKYKFDIIVPVYNVSQYLVECIESCLNQSYKDYRLILIDDGSNDGSADICKKYASLDKRIMYVYQENQGLSAARNTGISFLQGDYTIFLDSDDLFVNNDALKIINDSICESNAECLVIRGIKYYGLNDFFPIIKGNFESLEVNQHDKVDGLSYLISNNLYKACAWNKIVKTSIIKAYDMHFPVGYLNEDIPWCADLIEHCENFGYCDIPLYGYRQNRKGSITSQKNIKLVNDRYELCEKVLDKANNIDEENKNVYLSYLAYEYAVLYGLYPVEKSNKVRKYDKLLNYSLSKKVKFLHNVNKILGCKGTMILAHVFVRIKK